MSFDRYAEEYDVLLDKALHVSGENRDYFARSRIEWLAACLRKRGIMEIETVLDFGCGTGSATPHFFDVLGVKSVRGVDASQKSIEVANRVYGSARTQFFALEEFGPKQDCDLVFCNGVFHHIAPNDRNRAMEVIFQSLRPRGLFALWENNPWNPGTRLIMKSCAFDRDATMLVPALAKKILRQNGFEVLALDHLFIFPKVLRAFRFLEPLASKIPLGAQYQVFCRKIS